MTAYWIAHVTVHDADSYAEYQALAPAAFARFGARFLARGGDSETLEGAAFERHVIIAFATLADARACYDSPEYQIAKARRIGASLAHVVLVEGILP